MWLYLPFQCSTGLPGQWRSHSAQQDPWVQSPQTTTKRPWKARTGYWVAVHVLKQFMAHSVSMFSVLLCQEGMGILKGLDCFQPGIKVWKGLTPLCISILDPMRVSNLPRWTCYSRKTCQASRSRRCPVKVVVKSSHFIILFFFGDVGNFSRQFWHFMELDFGWFWAVVHAKGSEVEFLGKYRSKGWVS